MSRSHPSLDLPAGPPPEVLDEVAAAWERAQDPLPLDFCSDPVARRAWGELRLPGGAVERISARDAVAIACGDIALAVSV